MATEPVVLVIEDDAETRRLMRRVLEDAAFAVVTEGSEQSSGAQNSAPTALRIVQAVL